MNFTHSLTGGQVRIAFDGKPSEAVRRVLKSWGCRWSPELGIWHRPKVSGAADLLDALRKTMDREQGVRRPDGACWRCHAPEGFFRPHGAATPVHCDSCHDTLTRGEG